VFKRVALEIKGVERVALDKKINWTKKVKNGHNWSSTSIVNF
jgi:hypothetical protein